MTPAHDPVPGPIAHVAANWVVRRGRGLSAAEQDEFLQWLAADPRHREAFAWRAGVWEELDRLAGMQAPLSALPDPDLLAPSRPLFRRAAGGRAFRRRTMVVVAVSVVGLSAAWFTGRTAWSTPPTSAAATASSSAGEGARERRVLPDGSTIELNGGARVAVEYAADVRRVWLEAGEAAFQVERDSARPFEVIAGGVRARALGTAFNVHRTAARVEVVVSEGHVAVDTTARDSEAVVLGVGQRVQVAVAGAAPGVAVPAPETLGARELEERLAWQSRLLVFVDTPLEEIVAQFNRRPDVRLRIESASLRGLRLNGTFRSDNVEGFLRLMESDFGMQMERRESEIVIRAQR